MLTLEERMKRYEHASKNNLMRRTPAIIRIDGKAFHTFTKGLKKPFDEIVMKAMEDTTRYLCKNIQGVKLAYTQSDEISLLLTDYEKLETEAWFGYNIQKVVSVSASMATLAFNESFFRQVEMMGHTINTEEGALYYDKLINKINTALFDSRVFLLPKEEVCNYFIWRQQDAIRNSKQALGQSEFSAKDLHGLSTSEIENKLIDERDISWVDYSSQEKYGALVTKDKYCLDNGAERTIWVRKSVTPLFKDNRNIVNDHL
ncbi:MAG: tRNA(His) guanylyltransferase Thg1 family protein [Paraclostridium sp.]